MTLWLTAFGLGVGGINEFSARLPSLLLAIGIGWILFYLVKVQRGVDNALSTVFILSGSVLFFVMSGTVAMDQCLTFGITLALAAFWLALRGEQRYWGYVFFLGLSIGLMAKGPITLVLTGISIGFWTFLTGRWLNIWQRIPWISGTLMMLCVCVPWYWLAERHTPGFLDYFFIGEHWKRFTESGWKGDLYGVGREHARGMIWLYWLAAGFPWSLFFVKTLMSALAGKKAGNFIQLSDDWQSYCLLWMLSPLLFFTFSANVIWTYVLPGLPGLALLIAEQRGQAKKSRAILGLCVPVCFLAIVGVYQFPESALYQSQKNLLEAYRSQKSLVAAYLQEAAPDERLIYLTEKTFSIQFYLQGKAVALANADALEKKFAVAGHDFYVLRKPVVESLSSAVKAQLEPVKSYGEFMLFHAIGGKR